MTSHLAIDQARVPRTSFKAAQFAQASLGLGGEGLGAGNSEPVSAAFQPPTRQVVQEKAPFRSALQAVLLKQWPEGRVNLFLRDPLATGAAASDAATVRRSLERCQTARNSR